MDEGMDLKIKKFRKALQLFIETKLEFRLNQGELDGDIKDFLTGKFRGGDIFSLNFTIEFLKNDVLFMNTLMDGRVDSKVKRAMVKLWAEKSNGGNNE